jgi:hypothetical protein
MKSTGLLRVCAVGCIAVLAACGGSSSKTASTVGGSSAPSSSSPAASPSPASQPQLQKIVLQPADLPAGWKGTPSQDNPSADAARDVALYQCLGVPNYRTPTRVDEAFSDDFTRGDAYIYSSASSYRSQSEVEADVAAVLSPKFSPCIAKLIRQQAANHAVAVKSVSVKVTPGSAGGPANVAATGVATFKTNEGGKQTVHYSTVAYIIGPFIEAEVDSESIGAPVPASLMEPLVATVANRAAGD